MMLFRFLTSWRFRRLFRLTNVRIASQVFFFVAFVLAVWADERIDAAVSRMDNTKKLAENIAAAKSPIELSMNEFQQLRYLARATAPYSCQGCAHICESMLDAPVKVADPLRYLMYHESYGDTGRAKTLYARLRPAERAMENVDFSRASAACPQGIDIAARLAAARRALEGVA